MKRNIFLCLTLTFLLLIAGCKQDKTVEFAIGADISFVQRQEDKGVKFSENGIEKDVLQILKENNFNWIRLRLFVDPTSEKGYSREGYCGLEKTLEMAKRVKAAQMNFLLDFHYSDTWADPEKQFTPSAWIDLKGEDLENQVYNYTKEAIEKFKAEGACPDMVQIGNEINHGMLWPEGNIEESFKQFGELLRSASDGVRDADPNIKIMIHIACGGQNDESVYFIDNAIDSKVDFDVIGESYYPKWHGSLSDLENNLNDLALRYNKPIVIVEYQDFRKEVNEIASRIPNKLGMGTFIWEATSSRWGNLFDDSGATTDNMNIYKELNTVLYQQ